MTRLTIAFALALLLPAQNAPKKTPENDIFSGNVAELNPESVTVERTALLRDTVKRTFVLDSQTVVEGKLKLKARVSVRYSTDENGQFHALHIIVR